jgi:L-2,4-diaminobutyric acid acetyltransferase
MSTIEARPRSDRQASDGVALRAPRMADAARVHALVAACPPLDRNSVYAYLLVCTHFAATSVVAERDGALVGFVSAYVEPDAPGTAFVWQVAVAPGARGLGLARWMLDAALSRPACRNVRWLETTINPSNDASWKLFASLARGLGAPAERCTMFDAGLFGAEPHEEETLVRIGPFPGPNGGS